MSRECEGCGMASSRREFIREVLGFVPLFLLPLNVNPAAETIEYAIPSTDGPFFDNTNDVIVMRWQNFVYAFSLACPHQNTALRWKADAGRFQCPKHNSKYQPNGTFISGRATRGMDRFAVYRKGESIVVELNKLYSVDKDPAAWKAAVLQT